MDVVGMMERVKETTDDIAFTLSFTKARERTPENRADFEPVTMALRGSEWTYSEAKDQKTRPLSNSQKLALDALASLVAKHGDKLPPEWGLPAGLLAIPLFTFRTELISRGIVDGSGTNPPARLKEVTNALKARGLAAERDGRIWLTKK
jgi:hypothetical protein